MSPCDETLQPYTGAELQPLLALPSVVAVESPRNADGTVWKVGQGKVAH